MMDGGHYYPSGETVRQFHRANEFYRNILGPFGSGKTTACCMEYFMRAIASPPDRNGVRHSRGAVIRNRISDLESTTVKSWNEMFESRFGRVQGAPTGGGFVARWTFGLSDGTRVSTEVRFFPFDGQSDIKRLLGSEYTFAFLNEVRELPKSLMNILPGRLRYPRVMTLADGYDEPWHGIWSDTNPPDLGHWLHKAFNSEEGDPEGWRQFRQPPGVIKQDGLWVPNPKADNVKNLRKSYYPNAIAGQPEDVVRVNYGNEYGFIKSGKPIVPNFSDHLHVAREKLQFNPDIKNVYVGIDFGSTPAAAWAQEDAQGRWTVICEQISLDKPGIRSFALEVILPLARELEARGHNIVYCGDPAGKATDQTHGDNCFEILSGLGIEAHPAYTNGIEIRGEVVDSLCRQLVDGKPRLLVSPSCPVTIQAFAQKYVYEAMNQSDVPEEVRYHSRPKKDGNAYSHIADAVGYCIMGSGYGAEFVANRSSSRGGPIEYRNRNVA